MGSSYRIAERAHIALDVNKHSNKFDIGVEIHDAGGLEVVSDLTVDQLAEVGLHILKIASWWSADPHAFKKWLLAQEMSPSTPAPSWPRNPLDELRDAWLSTKQARQQRDEHVKACRRCDISISGYYCDDGEKLRLSAYEISHRVDELLDAWCGSVP